jgi:Tfp pilus assembly protein PilF
MAKLDSCLAVVIILLLPIVLSCSKRQAAPDSRQAAIDSFKRRMEAFEKGDRDLAVTCFTEAIRLDPKMVEAYSNKGEFDKAVADFTEAIRLVPDVPQPYLGRAKAHRALGDEEKAAADERKAEELSEGKGSQH